jgi:AraC family transcriptional regulator
METQTIIKSSSEFESFSDFYLNSAYADFPQEHRSGGSFDIGMIQVDQAGHEFIDPPIPQLSIVGSLSASRRAELDFGDGWTKAFDTKPGMFGPQPANQECRFRIEADHTLIVAYIPAAVVNKLLSNVGISDDPFRALYARLSASNNVLAHLQGMWSAMEVGGPANNLLIDAHVIALLGLMMTEAQDIQRYVATPSLDNIRLARVVDYIETHFGAPLLISELATIAAMSPVHFGRSFKLATGHAPYQYLTQRRIEHSRRMLRGTAVTVTEIAYLCGFANPSHFSTVFSKALGLAPSAYRLNELNS